MAARITSYNVCYTKLLRKALEGPYGDHTGYYNSQEEFPVFEVSAITMRKNPIYVTTYTSRPPDEPSIIAVALNDLFVPIIKQQFPEIVDFWLPPEGVITSYSIHYTKLYEVLCEVHMSGRDGS